MMKLETEDIKLDRYQLLKDVQEAFTSRYPYLKIDFFEVDPTTSRAKTSQLNDNTKLTRLPKYDATTSIAIGSERTVAEVTSDFFAKLGVFAKLSRKSGNIWNLITVTESWTLKTQNTAAEFISSLMKVSPIN